MSVKFQRSRRVVLALMVSLFLIGWAIHGWAAQSAQTARIGVVDIQQVLNQSQKGMLVKQKLDQERAVRQRDLDGRRDEVEKLQADLGKQGPLLSEQAKRERSEALERKVREVRRLAEDANRDFEKRVRDAELETTREILAVIQEYGKDQGYTLILERSTVIFGAATVDLTAEIVKRYDGKQK